MSGFGTQIDIQRSLGKFKHTQMKNMIKLPAIVLGLVLLLTGTTQRVMAQDEDISLQSFYDELSPYGTWIQDPEYGYVWRPDVDQGEFRPYYTNGHWVMTEYGNTWVSNYDWGWGPFHYGRWVYNRYNQWIWLPDTVWGPAWVSWRSGGGYYGWAPMGPGMNINVNINIPSLWWVFIPQRNIYYDNFPRYYSRRNTVIIHNTTIINNTYVRNRNSYYTGPRADEIRRYTGRDVNVYSINRTSRPGRSSVSGSRVEIYSPRPGRGSSSANAAPRTSVRGEGYATARPDRSSNGGRDSYTRPSRADQGTINRRDNDATPRTEGSRPERPNTERATRDRGRDVQNAPRDENRVTAERPERAARPERSQPTVRTEAPVRVERQEAPQRQEQPRQEPVQRQEQPRPQPQQRQEAPPRQEQARPQPQPRTEQARPSSSGSQSRGSEGGGRESSGRSSRGGRG